MGLEGRRRTWRGVYHQAFADAREAQKIAQRCEYYWGLHESLRQLRDTAEALRINREHDQAMERLYGK